MRRDMTSIPYRDPSTVLLRLVLRGSQQGPPMSGSPKIVGTLRSPPRGPSKRQYLMRDPFLSRMIVVTDANRVDSID